MKAVVLAAGEGTRMRPLTETRPKPMLPVAGQPLLAYVLDACVNHVDGYVIVVGYEAEAIRDHFGDEYKGRPIAYVRQDEQLGTGHAFGVARSHVNDDFLALNGDVLLEESLVAALANSGRPAIGVKSVDDPSNYGVVEHDGETVIGIIEKPNDPATSLANLGVYRFPYSIFEAIDELERSPRGEYEITDALDRLIAAGHAIGYIEYDGRWLDVGRPWELLDAQELLLEDIDRSVDGTVAERTTIEGPVVVEPGARVRAGTYLEGPVRIQAGADVGPNSHVRGATAIGPNTRVGTAVEVKNSILMAGSAVPHHAYVGDSVLGRDVNFGAGTKVANLRHDDATVSMTVKGEAVDTGRRKLGVVVGDGAKTGINTSLNPGVKLGANETTLAGEAVTSDRIDSA